MSYYVKIGILQRGLPDKFQNSGVCAVGIFANVVVAVVRVFSIYKVDGGNNVVKFVVVAEVFDFLTAYWLHSNLYALKDQKSLTPVGS